MAVQINVQASQAALIQSINQGVTAFNTRYAGQNQLNLQINARSFSQPLGRITSDLADFESALKASNARVLAFGASTAVLGGVVKTFKEIASITMEVEKSLTDVNRVLGLSTSGLQKFSSDLFSISKQTASSFDDATKAALEFSRQGLNTEETLKRTADALTLVRLTGISSRQAVEDLTSTINGFSKAGLTTSQVVNKLAAVEQDFAVSASDLTEALSRTGQAAQEAGVEFDQLNALVTTAQQSTARGGAVIGNALKTIFTRLQRTDTLDQLEKFNVIVRDIEGNILPAIQILQNFANRYNDLADAQRAQLSEQVAGVYQVNILKGIINDLSNSQGTYIKALERGAKASNEADIANQKLNKTLSALTTQTGLGLQQLANTVGKATFAPLFEAIVSPVNDAVKYINDTLEGEGPGSIFANGLLKGIRNVITGPGLAVAFAVIAKVAKNTFEDATKALPAILGMTTEAQKRANIEKSILTILQGQGQISQALIGQQGNSAAQAQLLLNLAKAQTAQYQQQLAIAQQLAGTLVTQGVTVGTRGLQVGPKIKAGGHIPAHAAAGEKLGAMAGGYKPGKVIKAPSSVGNAIMNSAEEVRYFAGFSQPFINPPANSKAGRAHRQKAINRTGVDPYMASGFIPNFANENQEYVTDKITIKDGDTINAYPVEPISKDYRLAEVDAVESNQKFHNEAVQLLRDRGYDKSSVLNEKITKGKAAYYRGVFSDKSLAKDLINEGLAVPDLRYTKDFNLIALAKKRYYDYFSQTRKPKGLWGYLNHPKNSQFTHQMIELGILNKSKKVNKAEAQYKKSAPLGGKLIKDESLYKKLKYEETYADFSNGFIPNFAPPTSAIRIPWFKKFGNPAFDAIQPALGISKASDVDTFRQVNFRSTAEGADENGDSNIFGPLYETFSRKALQLINKSNIFGEFVRGSALQPKAISSQTAFDEALLQKEGIVAFDFKGFPKKNLSSGSVTKHLNDKFNRVVKTDPEKAAKIKESIMAFNETGHESQLPSQFGKNFLELAGTSYSQMLKNSPGLVKALSAETDSLLNNYIKNPAFLAMAAASGFIPNFAGKEINTKFFRTKTGFGEPFSKEGGTGLSGTVYRQPGFKSYGYQLKEQLNNMVMSILGNNVFIPDTSYINPKLTDDVNAYAENSARVAALRLSSAGKTKSLGMERGMMSEAFGNSRYVFNPNSVYTGQVSGRMKRVNYDRLSDVLGVFWSSNPETKSAWEDLKSLSESGKYEDKEKIRPKTALLKKAYNDWLAKNQYIGTRVKLSDYRQGAEGVRGANYAALRSDLAGVSNLQNLGEMEKLKKYKEQGIFYGDYKNNKAMYDKMGRWTYNAASKKMILNSASGFIPNLADVGVLTGDSLKGAAYKQALQFLADTNKPISSIIGPAGSGKTTRAVSQYGGEIMTGTDFNKYSSYVFDRAGFEVPQKDVVSAENIKKIMGKSNMIDILIGSRSTIKSAREKRVAQGDLNIPGRTGLQGGNKGIRGFTKAVREFAKNNPQARILRMLLNEDGTFSHQEIGGLKSALGFIPNFAYKQAVMGLEESMSGNKAIFDTKPFPHIRNSSQPTFSSAIADHGGLNNALSDSMRGQKAAGLMSGGLIPNFATINAQQAFGTPFGALGSQEQKAFVELNKALSQLTRNTKLTAQQQQQYITTVMTNAASLAASTKSTTIVSQVNTALATSLQQNQNAQQKAAAAAAAAAAAQRIAYPTRIGQQRITTNNNNFPQVAPSGFNNRGGGFKTFLQNTNQRFEKISNNAAFQIATPMIAGQLEAIIAQGKDRSEMSVGRRFAATGASAALTGASTGALLGSAILPGFGTAIGAAAGAAVGLSAAFLSAKNNLDDFEKTLSKITQKDREAENALGGYVDSVKKLEQGGLSQKEKSKIEKEREKFFLKIPTALRSKISPESTSIEIEKMFEQFQMQNEKKSQAAALAVLEKSDKTADDVEKAMQAFAELSQSDPAFAKIADLLTAPGTSSRESRAKLFGTGQIEKLLKESETFKSLTPQLQKEIPKGLKELLDPSLYQRTFGSSSQGQDYRAIRILRERVTDVQNAKEDFKGSQNVKNVERTATSIFLALEDYFNQTNNALKKQLAAEEFKDKFTELKTTFDNVLIEGLISPAQFVESELKSKKSMLQNSFDRETRKSNQEFSESFANQIRNTPIFSGNPTIMGNLESLSMNKNAGFQEYKTFFESIMSDTVSEDVVRKFEKILRDQQFNENERKENLNREQQILDENARQQRIRQELGNREANNAAILSRLQSQREGILASQNVDLEIKRAANQSYLNYQPNFYNMGMQNESALRIQYAEAENAMTLESFRKSTLISAKQISEEAIQRLRTQIESASASNAIDKDGIIANLEKSYFANKSNADKLVLENLPQLIQYQRDYVAGLELTDAKRKEEEKTLTQLERLQTDLNDKIRLQNELLRIRNEEERKRLADSKSFTVGLSSGFDQINRERETFARDFGQKIPMLFRDGIVGALDAAANSTDNLETALMGVAANFLKAIQGAMFQNIANELVGSFGSAFSFGSSQAAVAPQIQRGGVIRAQNGMYISGGRTGDKNPALLEDGEYVLNRNAVRAMGGPKALDNLNFNSAPRFATGGDPGSMSASVNLSRPFADLSAFGREQSPEFQAYVDEIKEQQAIADRKKKERKALLNQFLGTLITTGISMGISAGFGALKENAAANANLKGATGVLADGTTTSVTNFSDAKSLVASGGSVKLANGSILSKSDFGSMDFTKSSFNQIAASKFAQSGMTVTPGGMFGRKPSYNVSGTTSPNSLYPPLFPEYGTKVNANFSTPGAAYGFSNNLSNFKPTPLGIRRGRQEGGIIGFNQGGFLPYGSRLTDSIPAYLSGGEYIVNSKAVRKYGVGGLNRINSGVAKFAEGGMVGGNQTESNNTSNSTANNISINITVNANGNGTNKEEKDNKGEGTEGPANELSNRIKSVVLEVISNEQRTGGLLDSTKKK